MRDCTEKRCPVVESCAPGTDFEHYIKIADQRELAVLPGKFEEFRISNMSLPSAESWALMKFFIADLRNSPGTAAETSDNQTRTN